MKPNMKRQTSRTAQKRKIDKTVTKKCPACSRECPVARKSCDQCGAHFASRTRTIPPRSTERTVAPKVVAEDPELTESKRRRFRTKRMRPDFFNPLDMEYSSRRKVKVPEKKRRGRPKGAVNKPASRKPSSLTKPRSESESKATPPPEEENNMYVNMPSEKMLQFNVILQELNHKFFRQNFKPEDVV